MTLYIPKSVDIYNTHLKNLIEEYVRQGVDIIVGYETYIYGSIIPDIIHFHMVEHLLGFINYDQDLFFRRLEFYRNHGTKLIFTAHNLFPHKKLNDFDYYSFFLRFLRYIDLFTHHGSVSIDIFKEKFFLHDKEHIICSHGDYLEDVKDFNESQLEAKELLRLPLNKKVILVFGRLQFKNIEFAKAVFNKVSKNIKGCILLLAGINPLFRYNDLNQAYYKINNIFLNKLRTKKRIINKRFSNHETFLLFKASDLIFLPHNSGLTSGIIPMAATIGKPFVYPNIGVFEEQAKFCRCEKYESSNINEAYNAIAKLLIDPISSFDNSEWLANNTWERHVALILNKIQNL